MPLTVADPFDVTKAQVIYGPSGSIRYWIEWPKGYAEHFADGVGNNITVNAFVLWDDAADFKYALTGWTETEGYPSTPTTFLRHLPHLCPFTTKLYCLAIRLVDLGMTADMLPSGYEQEPAFESWPTAGWCKYELTYGNLPYILRTDDDATAEAAKSASLANGIPELSRYVQFEDRNIGKERKLPSYGYETCEVVPTVVPETGFVPIYETEIIMTMTKVPQALRPVTAYAAAVGRVNSEVFYGKAVETMLFKGLAGPVKPYPDANGDLYVDLPYVFSYLPNGWNTLPTAMTGSPPSIVYTRVRKKGSATIGTLDPGEPLYASRTFKDLFKPQVS